MKKNYEKNAKEKNLKDSEKFIWNKFQSYLSYISK